MSSYRLILVPGEPHDLTGPALEAAARLAARGVDVELRDLREAPGERPFDARELPPAAWSPSGGRPEGWPDLLRTEGGWLLAGATNRWACEEASRMHPGHELFDLTGWFASPPEPEGNGQPGRVALDGLRWPEQLRLTGLLACGCGERAEPPAAAEPLFDLLRQMTAASPRTQLELDACCFFQQAGLALARRLHETFPELRWRLIVGPGLEVDGAAELPALGCVGLTVVTPTPARTVFGVHAPGADPDRLVEAVTALGGALPISLIYEVGSPRETQATQREGAARLRRMAPSLADFGARPLAPRQAAGFAERAGTRLDWSAVGPHGWSSGHVTHAWREKVARELQLAAEALGLPLSRKLSMPREFLRYRERIVSRLLDPLDGAPAVVRDSLPLVGVLHGQRAFAGPRVLEIDLTNDCNNTCVGCWCHSLMMGADRFSGAFKKRFLPSEILFELLDDAAALGTRSVQLAGSGEPFMHPQIIEVLEHAKRLGLEVAVITNVNFLTRDWADRLVAAGVDQITASVWAGTPEMYVATHPNQTEKSFERIREVLTYLWRRKRQVGSPLPLVKMYHVISSINCREIEPMVDLAVETGCEQVEFQIVDVVPGKSDALALSPLDRVAVIDQFKALSLRAVDPTRTAARDTALYDALDSGAEVQQFGKFEKTLHPEFVWADPLLETIHCPEGKEGSLPVDSFCDRTETRYRYFWSVWDCHRCPRYPSCPVDKTQLRLDKEFTELVGFGSFYRRLVSQRTGAEGEVRYEEALVDRVPCTVGWTYSRVRVSGHVIPCCKGHDHPLGSLHERSFPEIWYGPDLDEFRLLARREKKSHPYFSRINCYKACDNIGMNLATQRELEALSPEERRTLERYGGAPAPRRPD